MVTYLFIVSNIVRMTYERYVVVTWFAFSNKENRMSWDNSSRLTLVDLKFRLK